MSNDKQQNKSFYKSLIIYFYGRPIELTKFKEDQLSLLLSRNETEKVLKGYYIYYGSIYISSILTMILTLPMTGKISKAKGTKKLGLMLIPSIPLLLTFFYIHIKSDYYYMIRDVVKITRNRQNYYLHNKASLLSGEKESKLKVLINSSIDEHKYIQDNISITKCIQGAVNYYLGY